MDVDLIKKYEDMKNRCAFYAFEIYLNYNTGTITLRRNGNLVGVFYTIAECNAFFVGYEYCKKEGQ